MGPRLRDQHRIGYTSKDRFGVDIFAKASVHSVKLLAVHGASRPEAVVKSKLEQGRVV